jgi:DNA-binding response OmpR family regulator
MKVLVVEDDAKVGRFLVRVLREEGYVVDWCRDGSEAQLQLNAIDYGLILLDWMLPGTDGLSLLREIRKKGSEVPVLMLTARGETRERVLGLEAGADDYLAKPFEVEELLARLRALLRRTGGNKLRAGPIEVDRLARRVRLDGVPLTLTTREFSLLLYLLQNADRVVRRSELLSNVWEMAFDPGSNLIDVHVSRLRDKLGVHAEMLATVRGVGYQLRIKETE